MASTNVNLRFLDAFTALNIFLYTTDVFFYWQEGSPFYMNMILKT